MMKPITCYNLYQIAGGLYFYIEERARLPRRTISFLFSAKVGFMTKHVSNYNNINIPLDSC